MIGAVARKLFGSSNDRRIRAYRPRVDEINALEGELEALSDEALRARTDEFKKQLTEGQSLEDILVPAFATVREAAKRTLGQRHFDVQLIGGMVLHEGRIAEMKTGEGKTLAATPSGWARSTSSSVSPSASSSTGSTTSSARRNTTATSLTGPTTSSASTT